jgi:predicted transcriptional regulator
LSDQQSPDLVELSADIVAAYASRNAISPTGLTEMLASVYAALHQLGARAAAPRPELPKPLVPINKTITSDHLISLEDGKPYRSLKRHLGVRGLTPEEYRSKWGLPTNYPMVSPGYSEERSKLAKQIGLGRKLAAPPEPRKHARKPRE